MMEKNFCKQPGMVIFKNSKLFWNIFDLNFQAGANLHSEDGQTPTLNSYAS
jgi:hypothetical protein